MPDLSLRGFCIAAFLFLRGRDGVATKPRGRFLFEIRPEEVSIVDRPANKRKFLVIKRVEGIGMDAELLALVEAFAGKSDSVEKAQLTEDESKGAREALTLLAKYKDEFPTPVVEAIGSLAELVVAKAERADAKKEAEVAIDEVVEKAGARFSKETKAIIDGLVAKFDGIAESLKGIVEIKESMAKLVGPEKTEKRDGLLTPDEVMEAVDAAIEKALPKK